MPPIEFFIAFFIALIFGILIGIWIIRLLLTHLKNKKEIEKDLAVRRNNEITTAEPYTKVNTAKTDIVKENFRTLAWYLLYFVIIIPILVRFLGKIEYGANMPYIALLIIVGIPFLIAFVHVLVKVDHQRNRLLASGFSERQASMHTLKWLVIVPGVMILVIDTTLRFANSIR